MGYGQLPVFSNPGSPGWISVLQGSNWIPPRKFILGENTVLFCLFLILLDSILSPAQLIIPALMLAIDLSFLFSQSVSQLVWSFSHVRFFATPWIEARQASLSITNSRSLLKLRSIVSVIPSSHLILCRPFLLPPIPPNIRVFSNESTQHEVAKVLEFQFQYQSFQWTPRTDFSYGYSNSIRVTN